MGLRPWRAGTTVAPCRSDDQTRRSGCRLATSARRRRRRRQARRRASPRSAVPKSRLADRSTHEPALQLAVGDGLADVDGVGAGGDVPVDATDVVARLVGAGLAGLGAVAGHEAAVVAVQDAVEATGDVELEAAQHRGRVCASSAGSTGRGRRATALLMPADPSAVRRPRRGVGRPLPYQASRQARRLRRGDPGGGHGRQHPGQDRPRRRRPGRAPRRRARGGGAGSRGRRRRRPGGWRRTGPGGGPCARAARTRPRLARGLAPNSMNGPRSARPNVLGGAGGEHEVDGVLEHAAVDVDPVGLGLQLVRSRPASSTVGGRRGGHAHALHDLDLLVRGRVAQHDLHEEAVALGLGQRVDALGLDRVLGGQHQERRRDVVGRRRRWSRGARP